MVFSLPVIDEGASPKVTTRAFLEDAVNDALNGIAVGAMTGFPSYANTTLGLAATSDGEGFSVIGEVLSLYLNNAGVAELQGEISLAGASSSVIYAEDYGVHGDDFVDYTSNVNLGSDKSAALLSALTAANTAKATLVLPAGEINLESLVTISANADLHVHMIGQGEATRLLVDGSVNTDGALKFQCTGNANIMDIVLKEFVVTPLDASGGTQTACGQAIQIIHNASRKRSLPELLMDRVHVESIDLNEAYFNRQLYIENIWFPKLESCRINQLINAEIGASVGSANRFLNSWVAYTAESALHSKGNYGLVAIDCIFRCGGGTYAAGPAGAPVYIDSCNNAEGGTFVRCVSNFGKTGVIVTNSDASTEPGFTWADGHVNSRDININIEYGRATEIYSLLAFIDDYERNDGTNADAATNPILIRYGSAAGGDHIVRDTQFEFLDHTHDTNLIYIQYLGAANNEIYIRDNKDNSGAVIARGFDSTNQQRVYASNNVFDTATIPWDNAAATDYQYEDIQNGRRVIYGVGDPNGATMPGTLETTTIFIDTTDTLNRPPYRWLSGTAWSRDIGAANGDATDPGIAFANNTNPLGFYRSGVDVIGITVDGEVGTIDANGINIPIGATTPSTGTFTDLIATGSATVSGIVRSSGASPSVSILDTGGGTDEKEWRFFGANGPLNLGASSDAGAGGGAYLSFTRAGSNIQTLQGYRSATLRYELSNWDSHLLFSNAYGTVGTATAHDLVVVTNNTERMRVTSAGNVGIGTSAPANLLDVNADSIRVRTAQTPATAGATGNQGEIAWDANYIYVCTATNTWKRVAIATW